jgi:hypothetical protein
MHTYDPELKISTETFSYKFADQKSTPSLEYRKSNIFVLDNVLHDEECDDIKKVIDDLESKTLKTKICVKFSELSDIINQRCSKYLPDCVFRFDEDLNLKHTHNNNNQYWTLDEINPHWRLIKRRKEGSLSKHFDGVYVKSVDCKSIYTVMIYLENSDGDIKFSDVQFTPKKGRLIIFDQSLLHEGLPNYNHLKYYIRSEIMFSRMSPIESKNDKDAMVLYNTAIELYNTDKEKSLELESEAFKLSPLLEKTILNM